MGKSYWMTDDNQNGNFSNDKKDTFDLKKRYIGVRLQQGVPLLDRDWNELEDIRRYEEQMLRKHYIGNGSPDDGFKISACDPPTNDFLIGKGRCMVDGFEVINDPELYNDSVSRYTKQQTIDKTIPNLILSENKEYTVYLDVWIQEVRSKSQEKTDNSKDDELEIIDLSLGNTDDVGMETTIRHKLVWRVRIHDDSEGEYDKLEYHHYYDIAKIKRKRRQQVILNADISDLRNVNGNEVFNIIKNVINSLLKGNMPSISETKLFEEIIGYNARILKILKDMNDNYWIFWGISKSGTSIYDIWCNKYSSKKWGENAKLVENINELSFIPHDFIFEDKDGNIWFFWTVRTDIWYKKYSYGKWGENTKLTADSTHRSPSVYDIFEDQNNNIWIFWITTESDGTTGILCKKYSSGNWEENIEITTDATKKDVLHTFEDQSGNICVLWFATESGVISSESDKIKNFWCKKFSSGNWGENIKLTTDSLEKEYLSFEEHNGNLWLLWFTNNRSNLWCKRYVSGNWEKETKTTWSNENRFLSSLADKNNDLWFFWMGIEGDSTDFWCKRCTSDGWGEPEKLTKGPVQKIEKKIFEDQNGNIWIFWMVYNQNDGTNYWCKRYHDDKWEEDTQITKDSKVKHADHFFEDTDGNIWLFWNVDNESTLWCNIYNSRYWSSNIMVTASSSTLRHIFEGHNGDLWLIFNKYCSDVWCKRYIDGEWVAEMRLVTGTKDCYIYYFYEDNDENILMFWINKYSTVMVKKFYTSII